MGVRRNAVGHVNSCYAAAVWVRSSPSPVHTRSGCAQYVETSHMLVKVRPLTCARRDTCEQATYLHAGTLAPTVRHADAVQRCHNLSQPIKAMGAPMITVDTASS